MLTMSGGALSVQGNIVLNDQSQLTVNNGSLVFPQSTYSQYSIVLYNTSKLNITNSKVSTNGTTNNNFSMNLDAHDSSSVNIAGSNLSIDSGSWMLGRFMNQSTLTASGSTYLPTEIYPADSSKISATTSTFATLWLEFVPNSVGTVNVPQYTQLGTYDFDFGKTPGFDYSIHMAGSKGRLGLNSHPYSSMTVNGHGGTPSQNDIEIVFGYFVENNSAPVTLANLAVGPNITRLFNDQNRTLSMNNVNVPPLAWHVYVNQSNGFPVTITNSYLNEVATLTNGLANISGSTLQLAITGAVGPGSQLSIANSDVWSQALLAQYGGKLTVTGSTMHGNFVAASGTGSNVSLTNTTDSRDSTLQSCTSPVSQVGVPACNPLNQLGRCAQYISGGGGSITGSATCG